MVVYGSWISPGWKPWMDLSKICKNEENWRLVLLIDGTSICGIEGAYMSLVLVIYPCYHVVHLSITTIMIYMQLRSINLEEVAIKVAINLIILLEGLVPS